MKWFITLNRILSQKLGSADMAVLTPGSGLKKGISVFMAAMMLAGTMVVLPLATENVRGYMTPGMGITLTFEDLVMMSSGAVTGAFPMYQVHETITVLPTDTLLFMGGEDIFFDPFMGISLEILGTLDANMGMGAVLHSAGPGSWRGIWVHDSGGMMANGLMILDAEDGMYIDHTAGFGMVQIIGCTIDGALNTGITMIGTMGGPMVGNNVITGSSTGIFLRDTSAQCMGNEVSNCGLGIRVEGFASPWLSGNQIHDNYQNGVYGEDTMFGVSGNTIRENRGDAIVLFNSTASINDNTIYAWNATGGSNEGGRNGILIDGTVEWGQNWISNNRIYGGNGDRKGHGGHAVFLRRFTSNMTNGWVENTVIENNYILQGGNGGQNIVDWGYAGSGGFGVCAPQLPDDGNWSADNHALIIRGNSLIVGGNGGVDNSAMFGSAGYGGKGIYVEDDNNMGSLLVSGNALVVGGNGAASMSPTGFNSIGGWGISLGRCGSGVRIDIKDHPDVVGGNGGVGPFGWNHGAGSMEFFQCIDFHVLNVSGRSNLSMVDVLDCNGDFTLSDISISDSVANTGNLARLFWSSSTGNNRNWNFGETNISGVVINNCTGLTLIGGNISTSNATAMLIENSGTISLAGLALNVTGGNGIEINNSNGITLENLILNGSADPNEGCGDGIKSYNWSVGNIRGCTIEDFNGTGLNLRGVQNCIIEDCIVSGNVVYGIYFNASSNNTVSGLEMKNNSGWGAYLFNSHDNIIEGNDISSESYSCGIKLANGSKRNYVAYNWIDYTGYGVRLDDNAESNTVFGNTIINGIQGISLCSTSSYNNITNNTLSFNIDAGIFLEGTNNTVTGNNITNNNYGLDAFLISNCDVYHNSFIDNTIQARDLPGTNRWNAIYPVGGNYWSDYMGVDLFSGPLQNIPGPDGFGDTPYVDIQGGNGSQDNYPLMTPWSGGSPERVHNLDTGENFPAIQAAIDDPETLSGHTIAVDAGTYYEHVVVDKTLTLNGAGAGTTIVNAGGTGVAMLIMSSWVYVSGFMFEGGGSTGDDAGIMLDGVQNCRIENNSAFGNGYIGIRVNNSSLNTIAYNNAAGNAFGIGIVSYSRNNTAIGNTAWSNTQSGIFISSEWNYILNNTLSSNDWGGITLANYDYNTIDGNLVDGNVLAGIHLESIEYSKVTNNTVSNSEYGVNVYHSSQNLVSDNNCFFNNVSINVYGGSEYNNIANNTATMNGQHGIYIQNSDFNSIIGNEVLFNAYGIHLRSSTDQNTVSYNNVTNNTIGIYLSGGASENNITYNLIAGNQLEGVNITNALSNSLHHNSFVGNGNQAYSSNNNNSWNASYPSGGNYWSDYVGPDLMSGPLQNLPGPDGIGDVPYLDILGGASAVDQYPLMEPWAPPTVFNISLSLGWNLISIPLVMTDTSIANVLSSIVGKWDCVKQYEPLDKADPWKTNRPGSSVNDLFFVGNQVSVWIHVTEACTLTVAGNQPASTAITLYAGWNLVGYPTLAPRAAGDALAGTGFDMIECFDPASPYIRAMDPLEMMMPGQGYWIHVPADTLWTINW